MVALAKEWKCFSCGAWGDFGAQGTAHAKILGHDVRKGPGVTAASRSHGVPREGFSRFGGGFQE